MADGLIAQRVFNPNLATNPSRQFQVGAGLTSFVSGLGTRAGLVQHGDISSIQKAATLFFVNSGSRLDKVSPFTQQVVSIFESFALPPQAKFFSAFALTARLAMQAAFKDKNNQQGAAQESTLEEWQQQSEIQKANARAANAEHLADIASNNVQKIKFALQTDQALHPGDDPARLLKSSLV